MRSEEERSFAFASCLFSECICLWIAGSHGALTMGRIKWDNKIKDNNLVEAPLRGV